MVDKITNSIINGELSDGELLPPENELCDIFGISRSILRETIRVLEGMGSDFHIEFLTTRKALIYRVHLPIELHPISSI